MSNFYEEVEKDKEIRSIEDKKRVERMLLFSILFHILLIYVVFPEFGGAEIIQGPQRKVVTVRRLPPPRTEEKTPPKTRKREVRKKRAVAKPIPDPTPNEPEMEYEFDFEPEVEEDIIPPDAIVIFGDPEGPPAPDAEGPIRMTSDVVRPKIIKRVDPVYPELARQAGIQGVVIVEAVISKTGKVTDAKVLRGLGKSGLDEAAINAVLQWEFTPATLNGIPIDVYMTLTVQFKLN